MKMIPYEIDLPDPATWKCWFLDSHQQFYQSPSLWWRAELPVGACHATLTYLPAGHFLDGPLVFCQLQFPPELFEPLHTTDVSSMREDHAWCVPEYVGRWFDLFIEQEHRPLLVGELLLELGPPEEFIALLKNTDWEQVQRWSI